MRLRPLLLLAISSLSPLSLRATLDPAKEITQYAHSAWSTEEGLPHNTVPAILQTRDRFLWAGTELGLTRFDGAHFSVFNRKNTPELNSNLITALAEDAEGTLWIGTDGGGLTRYRKGRFEAVSQHFGSTNTIPVIYTDHAGVIWIGTDGGGLVRFEKGRYRTYTTAQGLSDNSVFGITEDGSRNLWIGTHNGLNLLSKGGFRVYRTEDGLPDDYIHALCANRDGGIWIGTHGGGISLFRNHKFETYNAKNGLAGNSVSTLMQDSGGTLWIGTFGGGVSRYSRGVFSSFNSHSGLGDDEVWALYEDAEGSLWIGTSQAGLHRLSAGIVTTWDRMQGLSDETTLAVMQDHAGAIWTGTLRGGVNRLKDGRFQAFSANLGLSDELVFSVTEGFHGEIWAGTRKGLNLIKEGKVTRFTTADGLATDSLLALYTDRSGNIWAGGRGGLSRYANGKFTRYTSEQGLSNNHIITIAQDSEGDLWIGTAGGLNRYHDGQFQAFGTGEGLSNPVVMTILPDSDRTLWVGTNGGGLNRFHNGKFTAITSRDGLPDDAIFGILDDDLGNLWMSGNQGIFRLSKQQLNDFAEGRVHSVTPVAYGKEDGMKSKECDGGFSPSAWKASNGDLWFPTTKGLVSINPRALSVAVAALPVFLEQANLNGKPSDLHAPLVIPPGRGDFEFVYTAIAFGSPGKVSFRYKLAGFDRDWVEAGARRTAYYTNVPPGTYQFQVTARRSEGPWSVPAKTAITLQPHLYQTQWFMSLGPLVFLGLIVTAHFMHVRELDRRERLLADRVNERTKELLNEIAERERVEKRLLIAKEAAEQASRVKSEFLANMSHEIRTPMHGVLGMTELALATELNAEQVEYLTLARNSAGSLLTIINDILDFSKIEAGKLELDPIDFPIRQILSECIKSLAFKAHEKGLEILCDVDPAIPTVLYGDSLRLRQILLNIIGNAIKFTAKGEIVLRASLEQRGDAGIDVHFTVRDTGVGIPVEKQKAIFEEFSQADTSTTRQYGGTGLGLAISSRLAQMMGGSIWVESEQGGGSKFHFRLLFQKSKSEKSDEVPNLAADLAGKRVLVVDDNNTSLQILGAALERWGMVPALACDGRSALHLARDSRERNEAFSLLLTDAQLPEMDGFQLVNQLHESAERFATIMMLTSGAREGEAARAQRMSLSGCITKPIALDDLQNAILRALSADGGPRTQTVGNTLPSWHKTVTESPLRILLAEDNPVNQKLAIRLLEKRGHAVEIARTGLQALARLKEETFDLLLTDIQMPEMDGFELVTALREWERAQGTHTPVVAMTALAMKGDRERCLALGMDGYVSKPMQASELFETIERYSPNALTHI